MLDEVHLLANGALPNDVIPRLEYLKPQLGQHGCHKVGICVGKEWHGGNQLPAVEVYDFLMAQKERERAGERGGKKRWDKEAEKAHTYA